MTDTLTSPGLTPNNNRIAIASIHTAMGDLVGANADGTAATWESRLPIANEAYIGLDFNRRPITKSHCAVFEIESDGDELEIKLGKIHPFEEYAETPEARNISVVTDKSALKFGLKHQLPGDDLTVLPRVQTLLEPGKADGFRVTAVKNTGLVVLQAYDGKTSLEVPGLTDNIIIAQLFLGACEWAIKSRQPGKFKSDSRMDQLTAPNRV